MIVKYRTSGPRRKIWINRDADEKMYYSVRDASQMIIGDMDHYHIYKTLHSTHKCT